VDAPKIADLPRPHEVCQRVDRLLELGVRIVAVELVEVDPVGAQAPEAVLDGEDDPAARAAPLVRVGAHRRRELGRDDHAVAPSRERLPQDLLGLAGGVRIGGLDEVDAGVEGGCTIRLQSARSAFAQEPKFIAPRQSELTRTARPAEDTERARGDAGRLVAGTCDRARGGAKCRPA